MTWAATAVAGAAVVGGYLSSQGAQNAAQTQAGAAANAQNISQNEFNQITAQEQPFMLGGTSSLKQLDYLLGNGTPGQYKGLTTTGGGFGSLLQPFTADTFQQLSPAYNFQRQQGMQGVLNSDASGAGALSGAAQKDLMGFNQNFANTSFANAFNMYQTQQGNIYDRLAGIAQLGQNAAANTGQQGTALAGQAAQSATNVGTALAAGQVGAANAYANTASSLGYLPYLYANQSPISQNNGFASSGPGSNAIG